ncbi:hypothetical protein [Lysinibacillus sphaericus]|nr:hypothetical protein [Lysinibacillus sphaericus]
MLEISMMGTLKEQSDLERAIAAKPENIAAKPENIAAKPENIAAKPEN